MTLRLRKLTGEEQSTLEKLAHSRTAPARTVERARILWQARRGEASPTIAVTFGLNADTVRRRIRRFNGEGYTSRISADFYGVRREGRQRVGGASPLR